MPSGPLAPPDADDALRQRVKLELRRRMRGLRKAHPASACAERSARLVARALEIPAVAAARAVALFWPMEDRNEVDLRPLDAALRARGARVAYPSIDPETGAMTLRFVADPAAMAERGLGFCEPSPDAPEALPGALDVVMVPALVVDPRGHRIGYGGGYYDRTLPRYAPPAASIAVAFDFQLAAEVPACAWDVPVAWVLTDARTLRIDEGGVSSPASA